MLPRGQRNLGARAGAWLYDLMVRACVAPPGLMHLILDGAHVVQTGTHDALIASGGLYSELYGIQARAYR